MKLFKPQLLFDLFFCFVSNFVATVVGNRFRLPAVFDINNVASTLPEFHPPVFQDKAV